MAATLCPSLVSNVQDKKRDSKATVDDNALFFLILSCCYLVPVHSQAFIPPFCFSFKNMGYSNAAFLLLMLSFDFGSINFWSWNCCGLESTAADPCCPNSFNSLDTLYCMRISLKIGLHVLYRRITSCILSVAIMILFVVLDSISIWVLMEQFGFFFY